METSCSILGRSGKAGKPELKEETRVSGIEEMRAMKMAASNGRSAVESRGRKSEELVAALLTVSFSGFVL